MGGVVNQPPAPDVLRLGKLQSLQVLRAFAATLVVWTHAEFLVARLVSSDASSARQPSAIGAFGVDVFFVISGAVMILTARSSFGRRGARWAFLRRRLARIYPVYWVYAGLITVALWLSGQRPPLGYLLESYLLVPVFNEAGKLRPVLGVGWTLSYELYFYLAFAVALFFDLRRGLLALAAILACGVGAARIWDGPDAGTAFFSDPIVVEFLAGVGIGLGASHLSRLPRSLGPVLAAAALTCWALLPEPAPGDRWLLWGPLATLLVLGAVSAERTGLWRRYPRWLVALGDASYSLYLLHPLLFIAMAALGTRLPVVDWLTPGGTIAIAIATSAIASLPAHWLIERRLTRAAQRLSSHGMRRQPRATAAWLEAGKATRESSAQR